MSTLDDLFDSYVPGDEDDLDEPRYRLPTICKHCRSAAVVWRKLDAGWRLHDAAWLHPRRKTLALHVCNTAASPDEFDAA